MHIPRAFLTVCLLIAGAGNIWAQSEANLSNQIREIKRKIASVKDEIDRTESRTASDRTDFERYRSDYSHQSTQQQNRIDSLNADLESTRRGADSLTEVVTTLRTRQKEFILRGQSVTTVLARACDTLAIYLGRLPHNVVAERASALAFLAGEITAHSVDNIEALERFWQILDGIQRDGVSLDVFTGTSPLPSLPGQVSFVRLGLAWFALVNEAGTAAALWHSSDSTAGGIWVPIQDPAQCADLAKAVAVRSGNAVPQMVQIPVNNPLAAETDEEDAQ